MSFRKISKNNNRNKDKIERIYTQTHTRENIKILSGSAFSVRPQAGTKRNFTNKCGEYKWCNGDRKSTRLNSSHVSQSRMPSSA